jgi:serine protease Do
MLGADMEVSMNPKKLFVPSVIVVFTLFISACGILPNSLQLQSPINGVNAVSNPAQAQPNSTPQATPVQQSAPVQSSGSAQTGLLAAYESMLENVYTQVNPSVVNIRVVVQGSQSDSVSPNGFQQNPNTLPYRQGLGSGFIWDTNGFIVTNNHVIENASKVEVTFSDGTALPATVVGMDVNSDLAVIKVDAPINLLHPVQLADSTLVKVGELAIAIGNPFGLQGTMTVGIISALGRTLPVSNGNNMGPSFSISDVIQTDAPINPGNSGGVLVDDMGRVMGVTAAIESSVNSNAGIGFVIPSALVGRVVPALIKDGKYAHPYLGITGATLTMDLAKAMNLMDGQRGILVVDVAASGPSEKAGLKGSDNQVTIDGEPMLVGGDVIIAINGQALIDMDQLIAYLASHTNVGDSVLLSLLRNGNETSVDVILAARPAQVQSSQNTQPSQPKQNLNSSSIWLGILGANLTPDIANALGLDSNQQGILIQQVEKGSPASSADLRGSNKPATINGQQLMTGGDIIVAVDGKAVNSLVELRSLMQQHLSGDQVTVTILRDGKSLDVSVTLANRPAQLP